MNCPSFWIRYDGFGIFDDAQLAGRSACKVLREDDVVEEIPCIAVGERAESGLEHVGERRVEITGLELLEGGFGTQIYFDALICGVVVEVAHGDDLRCRIDLEHRVGDCAHLPGDGVAFEGRRLLSAQPRGPVRNHEEEGFAVDGAPHRHDAACAEVGQRFDPDRDVFASFQLEYVRTVEESHIDTAQVGRVVMADAVICRPEFGCRDDVFEHRAVFDLRDADDDGVVPVHGGDVEQDTLHIMEFLVVFDRVPAFGTVGQKLFVVCFGIVDGVEEVLHVVEHDLMRLLGEADGQRRHQYDCNDQFSFHCSEIG